MEVRRDWMIPMRDGVHVAADIYLPEATPAAVILNRTPYLKDPLRQRGAPLPPGPFANMPPIEERMSVFIDAGFAVVVSDTRGTGHSEGEYDYYNFEQGPVDGVDMINWIESEPWCDGNIGMMGTSAGAVLAYCAANEEPVHLKAMVANMHPSDAYLDQWFVGGIFRYQNRIGWCTGMLERILPLSTANVEGPFKERIRDVHQQRFDRYYRELQLGKSPVNMDWFRRLFDEKDDGPFWKGISVRAKHDRVNVPVLNQGVWYDHFGRGTLDSHNALTVPRRLMMSPGMHGTRAGDGGFRKDQLRFFQHYLRDVDNGVMTEAPVRLYHLGHEDWVDHPTWPPASDQQQWYLTSHGNLQPSSPSTTDTMTLRHDPSSPNRSISRPQDLRRFEEGALVFTSPPMGEDTLVIGSPVLTLYAETDAEDVDWCIQFADVFPNGRSRLLNYGALKGSHVFSHENPSPLEPGQTYQFDIEIWPIANLFKQGHCLRVVICHSDFPFFEVNPIPSTSHLRTGGQAASRLRVPVVTGTDV